MQQPRCRLVSSSTAAAVAIVLAISGLVITLAGCANDDRPEGHDFGPEIRAIGSNDQGTRIYCSDDTERWIAGRSLAGPHALSDFGEFALTTDPRSGNLTREDCHGSTPLEPSTFRSATVIDPVTLLNVDMKGTATFRSSDDGRVLSTVDHLSTFDQPSAVDQPVTIVGPLQGSVIACATTPLPSAASELARCAAFTAAGHVSPLSGRVPIRGTIVAAFPVDGALAVIAEEPLGECGSLLRAHLISLTNDTLRSDRGIELGNSGARWSVKIVTHRTVLASPTATGQAATCERARTSTLVTFGSDAISHEPARLYRFAAHEHEVVFDPRSTRFTYAEKEFSTFDSAGPRGYI